MLSKIKENLKPWIEAVAKPLARIGLSPNHISLIALIIGFLAGTLFAFQKIRLAGVFVLAAGFFDMIDGAVARITGQVTEFGGVLDSVFDRIADGVFYVGIVFGGVGGLKGLPFWVLPVLALMGSFLVSYVRARAESAGTGELDVGIAERAERLLILAVGAFLNLIPYALAVIVVLTSVTIVQRIWESRCRLT